MSTTLVRSHVDAELRKKFEDRFGYGSIAWVVEAAMREILEMTEGQPDLTDLIKQAIQRRVLRIQLKSRRADVHSPDRPAA